MLLKPTSPKPKYQLLKTLTLFQVIMMGLAYIQPMTMFDTFAIVSSKTHGHVPTSYLIALVAILFTALSYGKLVRRYPSAGSAYTYTQQAISPHMGFMVGWSSLMDYLLMPMINVLLAKIYLSAMFPSVPAWIFVAVLVAIMTIANLKSINIVANLNTVIVAVQILVIGVFIGLVVYGMTNAHGAASLLSMRPFFSAGAEINPLLTGATILCFSFLGFDGISSLSEETKDANRAIPKAMFLTALVGGLIFVITSYFIQLYFPDVSHFRNLSESLPEIAVLIGGSLFQSVILYFACITMIASGLASHAGVSRLLYVMGRDGVFPERFFGYIHPRWRTPAFNVLLVGIFALSAVSFELDMALSLISFGALVAFTFVNLSVISLFYIRERRNKTLRDHLGYLLLPTLGALCVASMWLSLDAHSIKLGLLWAAAGLCYLGLITRLFRQPPPQVGMEAVVE